MVIAFLIKPDVYGIGVAEEVVHVTEDFLIGPGDERADDIILTVERVKFEHVLNIAQVDEAQPTQVAQSLHKYDLGAAISTLTVLILIAILYVHLRQVER